MKTKHSLPLMAFLMFSVVSYGQATKTQSKSVEKAELKKTSREASINQPSSRPVLNTTDGYMGKKESILKRLTVSEIPADFPKYKEGSSAEAYRINIKTWMKSNKHLLTEEFKNKRKK